MPKALTAVTDDEKKLIRRAYQRMLKSVKAEQFKDDDRLQILKAYKLAVQAHSQQRRKSGEPYVLHPIEVARICVTEIGLGPTAIICALLHDVVEDTEVTLEEIQKDFGDKIATIVDGLTKLDGLYNVESPQAENFRKVITTLVDDVRVVLIKMADRLHNLRTIGPMPRHKQLKIAAETEYIYTPLAHRLGLYHIRTEFQNHCLMITEPDGYQEIELKLQDTKRERTKYINEFIRPLRKPLDDLNVEYRVFGRPKAVSSIWNKIKKKQVPFEEIYDLFAVRVVCDVPVNQEKQVCWGVYSIITETFKPVPERLKDWVSTPKANGYESLHTTVIGPKGRFVEVQIRSERMDEIAERGFAAHWKYKNIKSQSSVFDTWLDNLREMLEDQHNDALEFISDFKTNLFQEEVFVYTPKGDLKHLPKGATALDFAFMIHSDIGYHCKSIKVNNRLVPMGYKLQNGDQIYVTTAKSQRPTEDWLKLVITGKARSKIRNSLKEEKKRRGELGKEQLMRKLDHMKVDFEENVDMLVQHFGFQSRPDLYIAIATEQLPLTELRAFNVIGRKLALKEVPREQAEIVFPQERKKKARKDSREPRILIDGMSGDDINFALAACCNPVQGDDIIAYVSAMSGTKIHRTNCPNATHLMANYGYRIHKAEWDSNLQTNFVVDLKISGVDDGPGVIERVTTMISSDLGINIRSLSIEGDEGYFEGRISLVVINKDQLNLVIRSLKELDGISEVVRTK
jgi:GTP pyrophosphokinase